MPNVMVALPDIGGALCSTPQSLADAHYYMLCSNAAKMRNPLKLAGVPQTTASGPKSVVRNESTVTRGHNSKLMKKRARSDLLLHSFSHRSVNRWNSLTQEEVDASSVNSFKTYLEKRRLRTSSWTNSVPKSDGCTRGRVDIFIILWTQDG